MIRRLLKCLIPIKSLKKPQFLSLENLQKEVSVLVESIEGRQFMAHANSILEGEEVTRDGGTQVNKSVALQKSTFMISQIKVKFVPIQRRSVHVPSYLVFRCALKVRAVSHQALLCNQITKLCYLKIYLCFGF